MKKRRTIIWMGAALLSAAILFAAISARQNEATAPRAAAEPDLFSFVKPLPDSGSKAISKALQSASREAALTPTNIAASQAAAQKMRKDGASAEDIYRMRATSLSPKIADLLTQMDSQETAWNTRVESYLSERARLSGEATTVPGTDHTLQQLRDSRFTSEEQSLLATYETSTSPQLTQ